MFFVPQKSDLVEIIKYPTPLRAGVDVNITQDINLEKNKFYLGPLDYSSVENLGVCCGANPMLIREVAESVGLKVPASKYRENMENHFMYGKNKRIPKHMTDYGDKA